MMLSLNCNHCYFIFFLQATFIYSTSVIKCPDGISECPDKNTCCILANGTYGCVPVEASETPPVGPAVCCPDRLHACPHGWTCDTKRCVNPNGTLPDPVVSDEWPYPMGMAGWQPFYNLCNPPHHKFYLARLQLDSDLYFPYYSTIGQLENFDEFASKIEMVMISQHGAGRNGDDYFCAGVQAALIQNSFPVDRVAVLAPRFMEPSDQPTSGIVWWNGSSIHSRGYWRAGGQSDPRSDPSGLNRTVSSFEVLDRMIELLSNKDIFPALRLITLAGHSSGGQIVQRYALFTHISPPKTTDKPCLRYIVANPSSFCYFDDRRWVDGKFIIPPNVKKNCPEYNSWHFGLDSYLPPYATEVQDAIQNYRLRDVTYLAGNNDTCNEAFIPGCVSHGLETTCMDMLEGRFRRERALHYHAALREFYGRLTHTLTFVSSSGHDHSLMWQSEHGLEAIFTPPKTQFPESKSKNL